MKTTFEGINRGAECRAYTVHRKTLERPSSIVLYFDCPWCGCEIKAYLWSLSGGGKRCDCGAIFGSRGNGYKLPQKDKQNENVNTDS